VIRKSQRKATKKIAIIVAMFIAGRFALSIYNLVNSICDDCIRNKTAFDIFVVLSHLNSIVNPILYAYHLKDFRTAMLKLLGISDDSVDV
jgi:hypothetical protein